MNNTFKITKIYKLSMNLVEENIRKVTLLDKINALTSKKYFTYLSLAFITIVAVLVYSNIYDNSTHFDDEFIIKNPALHDPNDFEALFSINKFRVVPFWTFAYNYISSNEGNDLSPFYTYNIIIHIINSFLAFGITLLLFKTPVIKESKIAQYSALLAFFIGLMFAVHPLQTQAVTYIYQRLASIAATFYYGSIFLYLFGRIIKKGIAIKIPIFLLSFIFLMLGLFSKENVFTIFPMILVIELLLFNKNFKLSPIIVGIFIVLTSIGFYIFTQFQLPANIIGTLENFNGEVISSQNYLITQFKVIPIYLKLFLIPVGQNFDHDVRISNSISETDVIIGLTIISLVIIYGLFMYRYNRIITFGIIWFFLTIAVESSVIPIADVIFEHRVYLPMLGLLIAFTATLFELFSIKERLIPILFLLLVIIISSNSALAYKRNFVWQSELTLWSDAMINSPEKARVNFKRGQANLNEKNYLYALYDFDKVIQLLPNFRSAYTYRAAIYTGMGKNKEAIKDYDTFLEIAPNREKTSIYLNRARLYSKMKIYSKAHIDYDNYLKVNDKDVDIILEKATIFEKTNDAINAIQTVQRALKIQPDNPKIKLNLGRYYYMRAEFDNAIQWLDEAINSPDNRDEIILNAYTIKGSVYYFKKDYEQAMENFDIAKQINPRYQPLLINLALLHRAKAEYQNELEAINALIELNKRSDENLVARGICYMSLKKYDEAKNDFYKALEINQNNKNARMKLSELQKYLK